MITVLFFAKVREDLGCRNLQLEQDGAVSIAELKQRLIAEHDERWSTVLLADNLICALNQQVVDDAAAIKSGDEVAFYPPVTGG